MLPHPYLTVAFEKGSRGNVFIGLNICSADLDLDQNVDVKSLEYCERNKAYACDISILTSKGKVLRNRRFTCTQKELFGGGLAKTIELSDLRVQIELEDKVRIKVSISFLEAEEDPDAAEFAFTSRSLSTAIHFLDNKDFADVCITCLDSYNGQTRKKLLYVQKQILSMKSEYFQRLLSHSSTDVLAYSSRKSSMQPLPINEFGYRVIYHFMVWLYVGVVRFASLQECISEVRRTQDVDILAYLPQGSLRDANLDPATSKTSPPPISSLQYYIIAEHYQDSRLSKQALTRFTLIDLPHLTPTSAIYLFARLYRWPALYDAVRDFILDHWDDILRDHGVEWVWRLAKLPNGGDMIASLLVRLKRRQVDTMYAGRPDDSFNPVNHMLKTADGDKDSGRGTLDKSVNQDDLYFDVS